MKSGDHATRKIVLIADDEPNLRLLVNATIASIEYTVIEAEDGDAAWLLLLEHRPAVALLDVEMPGQTGLELTRSIRNNPQLAAMRVILLTSKSAGVGREGGAAAGADRYLTKPFSVLELLSAVEQSLGLTP